jgi:hypothetical protein
MKRIVSLLSLTAVLVLGLAACGGGGDSDETGTPMTSVASQTAGDVTVELLTATRLETGLTPIYVKVTTPDGRVVTDATVTVTPWMDMGGGMGHGAPMVGNPQLFEGEYYACGIVFTMASVPAVPATDTAPEVPAKNWRIDVKVQRPGAADVDASFGGLDVANAKRTIGFNVGSPTGPRYVVSLNFKEAPKTGVVPVVLTVHTKQGTGFAPVNDVTLTLEEWMPAMGHGADGTVQPVRVSDDGRYEGKVAFTMPSAMDNDWSIFVDVKRGDVQLSPVLPECVAHCGLEFKTTVK